MFNRHEFTLIATGLLLGTGLCQPVGARPGYEAPVRLISGEAGMQFADASREWAIRPAEGSNPISQAPEAVTPTRTPTEGQSSQIKTDGGIRYVSGGVGESERTELSALSHEFNLHLMFATQGRGEYLSAVRVNILDARNGPLLTAVSKGPWFYAQLPPGDYSVEVTPTGNRGEGQTQRKAVHFDGSNQSKMDFYWEK
ncbi:carboxypeptidase regulatory-like domain-containing protein [Thiorhodococcus mannitoliphagus]|uniref:Carboxypeptidase regulatory-like domain-containing protein n=1 Tax=Thiorhodococcus mannitoliphagus TaxID=329406 RepID=A0A6P1E5D9_9GAMM|nr:carboxypeptidase regulatory-like domain-containing protein [Thiorhodococcus mannitoliphagus]NEX22795.1 carboxypeptidase regulatory-like domain-containing protein [Thiorhodococcus mannitoliphagus]